MKKDVIRIKKPLLQRVCSSVMTIPSLLICGIGVDTGIAVEQNFTALGRIHVSLITRLFGLYLLINLDASVIFNPEKPTSNASWCR
jgi:hypothetical protein